MGAIGILCRAVFIVRNCQRHYRTFSVPGLCPIDVKRSPLSPTIVTIQTPSLMSTQGFTCKSDTQNAFGTQCGGGDGDGVGDTVPAASLPGEALHTVPSHSVLSTEACQRIPLNPHRFCKGKGMVFTEQSASPNLTVVNKMGAKERSIHGFEPASSCQSQRPVWATQGIKVPARTQQRTHPRQPQL